MNTANLVPIYSQRIRKGVLLLAIIGFAALVIDIFLKTPVVSANVLMWSITLLLTCANFSKLGQDQSRDQLARYITLKVTFSYLIGLLMATSFTEIFLNTSLPSIKLFTAFSGNLVFIIAHYTLYFATDTDTELHNESFKTLIKTQKPLLLIAIVLSLITFLCIIFWL